MPKLFFVPVSSKVLVQLGQDSNLFRTGFRSFSEITSYDRDKFLEGMQKLAGTNGLPSATGHQKFEPAFNQLLTGSKLAGIVMIVSVDPPSMPLKDKMELPPIKPNQIFCYRVMFADFENATDPEAKYTLFSLEFNLQWNKASSYSPPINLPDLELELYCGDRLLPNRSIEIMHSLWKYKEHAEFNVIKNLLA